MSKSKGNVVTPEAALRKHGADAFRYWAAHGRLGVDSTYDDGTIRVGRRLAIKVLNASRFVLGMGEGEAKATGADAVTEALDKAILAWLAEVTDDATAALDGYEHARALRRVEDAFWAFCDDHLELVKNRAYGERGESAQESARVSLRCALSTLLRLLAPFLPYATEEAWSWWRTGSIHRAGWPTAAELRRHAGDGDPAQVRLAAEVIAAVRKAKSEAHLSMRADIARLRVAADASTSARLTPLLGDIRAAGRITEIETSVADTEPTYRVDLWNASEARPPA